MTADTIGGVWTYCMELCAALGQHEVSISLATMGRRLSAQQHRQLQGLGHVTLYESEYRLCWMQDSSEDVRRAGDWLLGLAEELEPDVIHLNDLGHGGLDWQAPVLLVGHSCVLSWHEAVRCREAGPQWQSYQELVRAGVQRADLVAAPTRAMLKCLLHHYGSARASRAIHNGRNFPPMMSSMEEKARSAEEIVFTAGRVWDEAKNISALSLIAADLPWPVHVAGEQSDPNGGRSVPGQLQCLGFLDDRDMQSWLARASIYAAPAYYEPFGLAILEAARAGCALVLSNIESLREVWGSDALYAEPDDPEELQHIIMTLIGNANLRQQMAARALRRSQRYFASHMAADYLDCYSSLLPARTAPRSATHHFAGLRP